MSFQAVIAGLTGNAGERRNSRGLGRSAPSQIANFDQPLFWVTVALLAFGLVMVYSATIALPDNPRFARYDHAYFLTRHIVFLGLAFGAALVTFQVPLNVWERVAPWLFVVSLLLLIAVLI
ncbi:MAG: FtsW/RodA/SpoVE family cell cycle protein, partial [Ramlibacter sp.]